MFLFGRRRQTVIGVGTDVTEAGGCGTTSPPPEATGRVGVHAPYSNVGAR